VPLWASEVISAGAVNLTGEVKATGDSVEVEWGGEYGRGGELLEETNSELAWRDECRYF
jgi:hypothetical protein